MFSAQGHVFVFQLFSIIDAADNSIHCSLSSVCLKSEVHEIHEIHRLKSEIHENHEIHRKIHAISKL